MNRLFAPVLLLTCWSAQAATFISTGTFAGSSDYNTYSYQDGDLDEDMATNNLYINDIAVFGLSQFNPALGTLTGITASASYTMDVTASIEVREAVDFDQAHSAAFTMTDGYDSGVGSLVRYDSTVDQPGHVRTLLYDVLDISVSCSAAAFDDPCMNSAMDTLTFSQSSNVFDNINSFNNLLAADYEGTGTLDGKIFVASLFYAGQAWGYGVDTINVLEADGLVEATLNSGTVTLTYTYSAVPLPASVWLLLTGVGALVGRRAARRL